VDKHRSLRRDSVPSVNGFPVAPFISFLVPRPMSPGNATVEHAAVKFGGFRTVDSATFNSEIGLLKRSTALRVRAISESALVYQRLCFGSDPRKNVQADIGWVLRDEIPNWTAVFRIG